MHPTGGRGVRGASSHGASPLSDHAIKSIYQRNATAVKLTAVAWVIR